MKNKSDVSHIVPNFFNMVKTQFGLGIKRFSMIMHETFLITLAQFFQHEGIIHESSCVNTTNRTVRQRGRIDTY